MSNLNHTDRLLPFQSKMSIEEITTWNRMCAIQSPVADMENYVRTIEIKYSPIIFISGPPASGKTHLANKIVGESPRVWFEGDDHTFETERRIPEFIVFDAVTKSSALLESVVSDTLGGNGRQVIICAQRPFEIPKTTPLHIDLSKAPKSA